MYTCSICVKIHWEFVKSNKYAKNLHYDNQKKLYLVLNFQFAFIDQEWVFFISTVKVMVHNARYNQKFYRTSHNSELNTECADKFVIARYDFV